MRRAKLTSDLAQAIRETNKEMGLPESSEIVPAALRILKTKGWNVRQAAPVEESYSIDDLANMNDAMAMMLGPLAFAGF